MADYAIALLMVNIGICVLLLGLLCQRVDAASIPKETLTVVIEDADSYPFEFRTPQHEWTGLHVDLIQGVAKQLRLQVEWLAIPWPRAQSVLDKGEAQAISYFVPTPGKDTKDVFLLEDNILHFADGVFFIRKELSKKIVYHGGSITSIGNHTIGIVHGDVIEDYLTEYYPTLKVDKGAKSLDNLFKMLLEKRFDVAIADSYGLQSASRKNPLLKNQIKKLETPIASAPAFIAFANTSTGRTLAKRFAAAFKQFRLTSKYQTIIQKYSLSPSTTTKH